jgi:hypothetical protein
MKTSGWNGRVAAITSAAWRIASSKNVDFDTYGAAF